MEKYLFFIILLMLFQLACNNEVSYNKSPSYNTIPLPLKPVKQEDFFHIVNQTRIVLDSPSEGLKGNVSLLIGFINQKLGYKLKIIHSDFQSNKFTNAIVFVDFDKQGGGHEAFCLWMNYS